MTTRQKVKTILQALIRLFSMALAEIPGYDLLMRLTVVYQLPMQWAGIRRNELCTTMGAVFGDQEACRFILRH